MARHRATIENIDAVLSRIATMCADDTEDAQWWCDQINRACDSAGGLRNRGPTRPTRRSEGLTHDTIVHPDGSTPAPRGGTGKDRSSGCDRVLADIKERCPISAQCCVVRRPSRAHGIRSGLHIQTAGAQVSPNGRRRWRKWARNQRKAGTKELTGRHAMSLRNGATTVPPLHRPAFTARSLVGMTAGAKKRKAFADWCRMGMRAWPTHAQRWRIGERLRPCKGCHKCKSRGRVSFGSLPQGFSVIVMNEDGKYYATAHKGAAWRVTLASEGWTRIGGELVTFGPRDKVWIIDSGKRTCEDGILPARKARKVRG